MIRLNETEEIIRLIYNGFDLELLSFELDTSLDISGEVFCCLHNFTKI